MNASSAVYLDSSALVKLVISEPESDALLRHLTAEPLWVSSALAWVEVGRAVRAHHGLDAELDALVDSLLERMDLVPLDLDLLKAASDIEPVELRSLDAIHLASAHRLGANVASFVSYDRRLQQAARRIGLRVEAPG